MEFDKGKVYTAVNADELKVGSKVFAADNLVTLRQKVLEAVAERLIEVKTADKCYRFVTDSQSVWTLAYLVEEPAKLKWTDLEIGNVITNGHKKAMVIAIDSTACDNCHINVGYKWLTDAELEVWEKVNENNN